MFLLLIYEVVGLDLFTQSLNVTLLFFALTLPSHVTCKLSNFIKASNEFGRRIKSATCAETKISQHATKARKEALCRIGVILIGGFFLCSFTKFAKNS